MKPLEYKREIVLEKLKENREEHAQQVARAWEGYWPAAKEMLQGQIALIDQHQTLSSALWSSVPQPSDYTKEYDRAIAQLEAAFGDLITLDDAEFRRYMLNEWEWAPSFIASTARYTG